MVNGCAVHPSRRLFTLHQKICQLVALTTTSECVVECREERNTLFSECREVAANATKHGNSLLRLQIAFPIGGRLDQPAKLAPELRERKSHSGIMPDNYQILLPSSNHIYTPASATKLVEYLHDHPEDRRDGETYTYAFPFM